VLPPTSDGAGSYGGRSHSAISGIQDQARVNAAGTPHVAFNVNHEDQGQRNAHTLMRTLQDE